MYKGGMSTRDVADFIECIITNTVLQDVHAWQERPIIKRYSIVVY
ncbi:hypothetical protein JCM16163A_43980 [Paenibacillus sp. YK5]